MLENRRHFRLREFMDVAWKVEGQDISGQGMVVNISASGLLLQTDRVFRPADNCILSIETAGEGIPFKVKKGRMMWFRRIHSPWDRFQCGIQFLPGESDSSFQQWLDTRVNRLGDAQNVNVLGNIAY